MSDPSANQPTPPAPPANPTPPAPAPPSTPAPAQDPPPPAPPAATDWKTEARKWEKLAKENSGAATKLQEIEEAKKTDEQKLADKLQAAETKSTTVEAEKLRLEVALDKAPDGMAPSKILKLAQRLRGSNREELEADAEELFADFTGAKPAEGDEQNGQDPQGQPKPAGAPRPDPAQGSHGTPPAPRPASLGQAVGAALARPKT